MDTSRREVPVGAIVGGAIIGLVAVAVILNIKDVARYIKISSM